MVSIEFEYQGDLHCRAVHGPSGTVLNTDAPKDNQGRGESFSPTDLIATALGSCMLTTMGILARRLEVNLTGATATVEKEMASAPFRTIGQLTVRIRIPREVSPEDRAKLENAAHMCPVAKSLSPEVQIPTTFTWG
ncbi:MAG TPA: OsmC family protein [Acidobacteriaceae bacterium]|nr:OsmC family protein [Acidobacteriaceae bacterium]